MKKSKARMLVAAVMLPVCGVVSASMGEPGRLSPLGVSYQIQDNPAAWYSLNCIADETILVPVINEYWLQASRGVIPRAGVIMESTPPALRQTSETEDLKRLIFPPDELLLHAFSDTRGAAPVSDASPVPYHGVMGQVARNFQRIEILQYAQTRVAEVIPDIEIPSHARAAAIAMEARHRSFMQMGLIVQALEYSQSEPPEQSDPSVVSPCLDSSKRLVAKVVAEFRAVYQETGRPLAHA